MGRLGFSKNEGQKACQEEYDSAGFGNCHDLVYGAIVLPEGSSAKSNE